MNNLRVDVGKDGSGRRKACPSLPTIHLKQMVLPRRLARSPRVKVAVRDRKI